MYAFHSPLIYKVSSGEIVAPLKSMGALPTTLPEPGFHRRQF